MNTVISKQSVENVCFKGGGLKGTAFVGVDKALTELGMWPQIKRFIGSSAGAIFAGASACRIPYSNMKEVIDNTDFSKFQDSNWGVLGEGYRVLEDLGMYSGDYFYNWYGDILEKYIGNRKITLAEIYSSFGTELVITTTDLTAKEVLYMDRHNYPHLELRDAVRRSMSIPVMFIPVVVKIDGKDHTLVDGGCTNNYPIDYFDRLYSNPEEAFGKTVGFDLEPNASATEKIDSVVDLVVTLIDTTIDTIDKVRTKPQDKYRSIEINTENVSSTNFSITKAQLEQLEDNGYSATMEFFANLTK